jgi:hypothetical protein
MATDLERGAYAGKDTYFYYNSATYAAPVFVEITRARNIQITRGAATSEVNFHGSDKTVNIHGYETVSGSFEYVRRLGTDAVYAHLEDVRDNKKIIEFFHLDGEETPPVQTPPLTPGKGWRGAFILGEFSETSNGGDSVVVTIPFVLADAYTSAGAQVDFQPYDAGE